MNKPASALTGLEGERVALCDVAVSAVLQDLLAEEKYKNAVEAGDAAVVLETVEPGLYTMNIGNLLPQETAKIVFRSAILYRWADDRLRFFLPATIAPRFGESPLIGARMSVARRTASTSHER